MFIIYSREIIQSASRFEDSGQLWYIFSRAAQPDNIAGAANVGSATRAHARGKQWGFHRRL